MRTPQTEYDNDEIMLRQQWRELNDRVEHLERRANLQASSTGSSYRSKLIFQTRLLTCVAFLSITWIVPLCRSIGMPLWCNIILAAYFIIMGIGAYTLSLRLRRLDLSTLSATDALSEVIAISAYRRRWQALGITLATPITIMLMYFTYRFNTASLYGCIFGAITGTTIGLALDFKARRWIAGMKQMLEREINGN